MSTTPTTQKALLLTSKQGSFQLGTRPVPKPGKGQILVKVKSAALNPADLWIQKFGIIVKEEDYPVVLGLDFAGDVVEAGEGVEGFEAGDRIIPSGNFIRDEAGFQEYALTNVPYVAHLPSSLSYDDAATLPTAVCTAYLGLYGNHAIGRGLGLQSFLASGGEGAYKGQAIFVAGASGSVGTQVIQMARLSGFSYIVATASLHNEAYLKSLGATHVLDRTLSASDLLAQLNTIPGLPKIEYAFDAYGKPDTSLAHAMAVLGKGGRAVTVQPHVQFEVGDGKTLARFSAESSIEENVPLLTEVFGSLERLLESGKIKPAKVDVIPGGLRGVTEGLKRIEEGRVSAAKLVVHVEETEV